MSFSLLLSHCHNLFATSHYAQRRSLSALCCLMFFQDLMLRSRLATHLQLASHVARLKEAICCNCPLLCQTFKGSPQTTRQPTRPLIASSELYPSLPNSKRPQLRRHISHHICKNKLATHQALHFSALLSLPHSVLSNISPSSSLRLSICLRLGQVTALRELRLNPTPTQLTHIIPAIFHKKGTFDINQPPSLSSPSFSHVRTKNTH